MLKLVTQTGQQGTGGLQGVTDLFLDGLIKKPDLMWVLRLRHATLIHGWPESRADIPSTQAYKGQWEASEGRSKGHHRFIAGNTG